MKDDLTKEEIKKLKKIKAEKVTGKEKVNK